jgi:hypothetical protein
MRHARGLMRGTFIFDITTVCGLAGAPPARDDGWALVGDWAITINDTQYNDSW